MLSVACSYPGRKCLTGAYEGSGFLVGKESEDRWATRAQRPCRCRTDAVRNAFLHAHALKQQQVGPAPGKESSLPAWGQFHTTCSSRPEAGRGLGRQRAPAGQGPVPSRRESSQHRCWSQKSGSAVVGWPRSESCCLGRSRRDKVALQELSRLCPVTASLPGDSRPMMISWAGPRPGFWKQGWGQGEAER